MSTPGMGSPLRNSNAAQQKHASMLAKTAAAHAHQFNAGNFTNTTTATLASMQQQALISQALYGTGITNILGGSDHKHLPPVRDDGIVIGETVAWRCWRVTRQTYLASMAMDVIWGSHEPMDGKIVYDHGQGDSGGVHAFKSQRAALSYAGVDANNQNFHHQAIAVGRVKLFGRIVEHEKGYRAEYARVAEIMDVFGPHNSPTSAELITTLNRRYCSKAKPA